MGLVNGQHGGVMVRSTGRPTFELPWQQASALLMSPVSCIPISSCLENDSALHFLWWRESRFYLKMLPATFVCQPVQTECWGIEEVKSVSSCLVTVMYLQFDHMTFERQDEGAFCIMSTKSHGHRPQADLKGMFALVMMNQGWWHSGCICRAWFVSGSQQRRTWSTNLLVAI